MRIVHILPSLARGGGEILAIELANQQAAAGHQVEMVAGHSLAPHLCHAPPRKTVVLHRVSPGPLQTFKRYMAGLRWLIRNRNLLRRADVIHCHMTYGAVLGSICYVMRASSGRGRPIVVETYHAVGMPIPMILRWLHLLLIVTKDAVAFMVEDPWWTGRLRRRKIPSAIIPAGLGTTAGQAPRPDEAAATRERFGIPGDALIVGAIGRLVPERTPDVLLTVFAHADREAKTKAHLVIAGDGPLREDLERQARRLGLADRVHFLGHVTDIPATASLFDIYLSPLVGAVCGAAGLETISLGVPATGFQLLDSYQGDRDWIWSSPDGERSGRKLAEMIESASLRSIKAKEQQAYLREHHSAERMAEQYEQFYARTMAET